VARPPQAIRRPRIGRHRGGSVRRAAARGAALAAVLAAAQALLGAPGAAAESSPGQKKVGAERPLDAAESQPPPAVEIPIEYRPPARGAPRRRVGGGVRGGARALPTPVALAPEHVALTASASPSLFWILDGSLTDARARFALVRDDRIEPVAELDLPAPRAEDSVERVRLADFGIELEPDVDYQWSVAVVPEHEERGFVPVATGFVRRVRAEEAPADGGPADYARAGFWYDALEMLSDAIAATPDDPAARGQRRALVSQVLGPDVRIP